MSFAEFIQNLAGLGDLSIGERFLLSILVWHCGTNGHCWPTVDKLTEELGGNRKTTFNLLRSLETKGYLVRTKKEKNQNVYTLDASSAKQGTTENCTSAKKGSTVSRPERCKKGDILLKRKKRKKEEQDISPSALSPVDKSKEIAEKAIDAIDLVIFKQKYPWLNIPSEHFSFKNHHLGIQANYHGPKKKTDWHRTFHTWCNADWKKPKDETTPETSTQTEPDDPTWTAIKAIPSYDFACLRHEAIPYARKKSGCGDSRDPPEDIVREYMIKLFKIEKGGGDGD